MRKCRFCAKDIQDASRVCEHCGKDLMPVRAPEPVVVPPAEVPLAPIARVSVVDISMPFGSMVSFMVTWALAAIPALLILAVFAAFLGFVFAILFRR